MNDRSARSWWLQIALRRPAIGLGACLLLAAGVYGTGLGIPYYGDDFTFYFPALEVSGLDPFVRVSEVGSFYRPLQDVILIQVQRVFGLNPVPVHVLQIALHLALVGLVYEGGRWWGLRRDEAFAAAVVMAFSQANVAAVLGNDTLSQVGGTLFGYLALRLYAAEGIETTSRTGRYVGALAALAAALFFKESSVAFLVLLGAVELVLGARRLRAGDGWDWMGPAVKRYVPVFLLFAAYLLVRDAAGARAASWGTEAYAFRAGGNVVRNAALFGVAAITPVSTPATVQALQSLATPSVQDVLVLGGTVAGGLAAAGLTLWGWVRRTAWAAGVAFSGMAAAALIPLYLLNDVSELYVYNAMPAVSLTMGAGLATAVRAARRRSRRASALVGTVLLVLLASHVASVVDKAKRMEATGTRTHRMLGALQDALRQYPDARRVCLTSRATRGPAYSIYDMPGVTPLAFSGPYLAATTGRDVLRVSVTPPGSELQSEACDAPDAVRLTWTGDAFVSPSALRGLNHSSSTKGTKRNEWNSSS